MASSMYDINDTITAISSASAEAGSVAKTIIRLSGPDALGILRGLFRTEDTLSGRRIAAGRLCIDTTLELDAVVYTFLSPHSYTGEDLIEIHLFAAPAAVECILAELLRKVRLAHGGEFTMRAYLNGKMDLAQAEAVAEIVASSNKFQLAAAQKLLAGALGETVGCLRLRILDIVSLIEAGLDFSTEDIEFVTTGAAVETILAIRQSLCQLLDSSIRYEEMIDMASVGLAGAPNAGKSSLLNVLLGEERSIVSEKYATTRDVLTGILRLDNYNCALFDCAGLAANAPDPGVLDTLARQAAIEALKTANVVLFCVDVAKEDYAEDIAVYDSMECEELMVVATKCDLLDTVRPADKLSGLNALFKPECIVTSARTSKGIEDLRAVIGQAVEKLTSASTEAAERIAINERHRSSVEKAIKNLADAAEETRAGNDEIAAMLLRTAFEELSSVENEDIDEAILEKIFSTFCIGK